MKIKNGWMLQLTDQLSYSYPHTKQLGVREDALSLLAEISKSIKISHRFESHHY